MITYAEAVKVVMKGWVSIKVKLIDRSNNEEVDALPRIGATPCPSEGRWIQVEDATSSISNNSNLILINQDLQD